MDRPRQGGRTDKIMRMCTEKHLLRVPFVVVVVAVVVVIVADQFAIALSFSLFHVWRSGSASDTSYGQVSLFVINIIFLIQDMVIDNDAITIFHFDCCILLLS